MKKLKLATKLYFGFGIMAMIVLTMGGGGYYGACVSDKAIEAIGLVNLPSVQALLVISEAQTAVDSVENALLSMNLDAIQRSGPA